MKWKYSYFSVVHIPCIYSKKIPPTFSMNRLFFFILLILSFNWLLFIMNNEEYASRMQCNQIEMIEKTKNIFLKWFYFCFVETKSAFFGESYFSFPNCNEIELRFIPHGRNKDITKWQSFYERKNTNHCQICRKLMKGFFFFFC